jgi:hypothetical protein
MRSTASARLTREPGGAPRLCLATVCAITSAPCDEATLLESSVQRGEWRQCHLVPGLTPRPSAARTECYRFRRGPARALLAPDAPINLYLAVASHISYVLGFAGRLDPRSPPLGLGGRFSASLACADTKSVAGPPGVSAAKY